jgi:S1-C subfamily serine protease
MRSLAGTLCTALLAACAQPPAAQPPALPSYDSVVPGSIGIMVRQERAALVVAAVRKDSAAARAGVRAGDIVLRYNGEPVAGSRHFYRLVLDSRPGSVARLEVLREGAVRAFELPVGELDTMPRA